MRRRKQDHRDSASTVPVVTETQQDLFGPHAPGVMRNVSMQCDFAIASRQFDNFDIAPINDRFAQLQGLDDCFLGCESCGQPLGFEPGGFTGIRNLRGSEQPSHEGIAELRDGLGGGTHLREIQSHPHAATQG